MGFEFSDDEFEFAKPPKTHPIVAENPRKEEYQSVWERYYLACFEGMDHGARKIAYDTIVRPYSRKLTDEEYEFFLWCKQVPYAKVKRERRVPSAI